MLYLRVKISVLMDDLGVTASSGDMKCDAVSDLGVCSAVIN